MEQLVSEILQRCDRLAEKTEEPGRITRTFLSPPMKAVHRLLTGWMTEASMRVQVDSAGNIAGEYPAAKPDAPLLIIGSHLDTVVDAGRYDGVLGVLLGVALVKRLAGRCLPFAIEVVGFSEEEGVRFGLPFIGSRARAGRLDPALLEVTDRQGQTVADLIRAFGLEPDSPPAYEGRRLLAYLEVHTEQGPVLEEQGMPIGVVGAIAGQSRLHLTWAGRAAHAGTTPVWRRQDALAGAAEFVLAVERQAREIPGLMATVGRLEAFPGLANVIPGQVELSLDVRHPDDRIRLEVIGHLLAEAQEIADQRRLALTWQSVSSQPTVPMDPTLTGLLDQAMAARGYPSIRMVSGAGHDAMVMAEVAPAAMLFVRSPGGVSHHPDETVLPGDVLTALETAEAFVQLLATEVEPHV